MASMNCAKWNSSFDVVCRFPRSISSFCFLSGREQREGCPSVAMDEPDRKRAKFSFSAAVKPLASKGRLPDLSKLSPVVKAAPASDSVRDTFRGSSLFIGIDIETHALIPQSAKCAKCYTDEFGLETGVTEEGLSFLRMIQLGWVIGDTTSSIIRTKLIKPSDFTIQSDATKGHHITHEEACDNGVPAQEALQEFFEDVALLIGKGYRLCAHHLGFDAGIILREFDRAGLHSCKLEWVSMVRDGLCTMDPSIGRWVRQQIGLCDVSGRWPLSLKDSVKFMLPSHSGMLSEHHHAGNDAHMHMLLAQELHRRVYSCLPDASHVMNE